MFSSASKYGIRATLFLASNSGDNQKWSATEIAKKLNVKKPFLAKILQKMVKNNLISSSKGPNGGFYLNKKNKSKNLIDILDCFDNLGEFETCILGLNECSSSNPCPFHVQAYAYREGLRYQFVHQTIQELAQKINQLKLKV